MKLRRVVLRERAERDIDEAASYYQSNGGVGLARRFISELELALNKLRAHPELGSTRYAIELDFPGLRDLPVQTFPFLIFYVFTASDVDVWRVLHMRRDLPAEMQGD